MKELKPGEIKIGPACGHGLRQFEKVCLDGRVECGIASDITDGIGPDALGYAEIEPLDDRPPGTYRVRSEVRFTSRGPATVNSHAYRSGWDAVFADRARAGAERSN